MNYYLNEIRANGEPRVDSILDLNALISETELDSIVEDLDALVNPDSWNPITNNSSSNTSHEDASSSYYFEQLLDGDDLAKLNSISESLEREINTSVFIADADPMMTIY